MSISKSYKYSVFLFISPHDRPLLSKIPAFWFEIRLRQCSGTGGSPKQPGRPTTGFVTLDAVNLGFCESGAGLWSFCGFYVEASPGSTPSNRVIHYANLINPGHPELRTNEFHGVSNNPDRLECDLWILFLNKQKSFFKYEPSG